MSTDGTARATRSIPCQNLVSPVEASVERVQSRIHVLRGQKVLLDEDLAVLYGVETKHLNKAVKRNLERFPEDFMF